MTELNIPDCASVEAAMERIEGSIHRTPVMTSRQLDEIAGATVFDTLHGGLN